MALGSNVTLDCENDRGSPTFPASFASSWVTVIDAGGMDDRDGNTPGTVVNVATDITAISGAEDHHVFVRNKWMGTYIVPCLAYSAAATVSVSGTIVMFGRKNSSDPWVLLRTKNGSLSHAFSCVATDASDGTLKYTTPNLSTDAFDTLGCNEFIAGVTVAHAVSAGSAAVAKLLVKAL